MKYSTTIILYLTLIACNNSKYKVPTDFNFSFSFDFTEKINSSDSTYKRKYVSRDSTISVIITEADRKVIFQTLMDNDFETLPYEFLADTTKPCTVPASSDRLIVTCNGVRRIITYSFWYEPKDIELSKKYLAIREKLIEIIRTKKEIEKLPESDIMFL